MNSNCYVISFSFVTRQRSKYESLLRSYDVTTQMVLLYQCENVESQVYFDSDPYMFDDYSVVDPGFPRRGASTPEFGPKPIIWQDFCQNLHENERHWTKGRHIPGVPLASTNVIEHFNECFTN